MSDTAPVVTTKKNGLAIASLVVGIVSLIPVISLGNIFGLLEGIIAVILGFIGASQIKKLSQGGKGIAVAGIILGFVGIVGFVLVILVLAPLMGDVFPRINSAMQY